jgi:hypothetical protein
MSLLAKVPFRYRLSRLLNSWGRNRPRLIRRRVLAFPPIASQPEFPQLVVLCEAGKFTDGLWAAWSWMRFLHRHLRLHLFVDGAISGEQRHEFERLFPGAEMTSVGAYLAARDTLSPTFRIFLENHLFALKLALLLALQKTTSCLYSDCDVLAFRTPTALIRAIEQGSPSAYIVDPSARTDSTYSDPWITARAEELGLPRVKDINGGLLWIARGSLDAPLVERLLAGWTPAVNGHFAEQTILGVLFAANGAHPLPETDYVVSGQGMHFWEHDLDCAQITVRHYVGNVRHRMYAHAYPSLAAQAGTSGK